MLRPVALLVLAVVVLVVGGVLLRNGDEGPRVARDQGAPATDAPDPAATDAASVARDPNGAAPCDVGTRAAVPVRPPFVPTPEAVALLARAATDPGLTLVTAEVRAVGPIGADGSQGFELFVLATSASPPRRYAIVKAPLLPAHVRTKFGVATEPGIVQVDEVRTFVLAKGRPDLGPLGSLLGTRGAFWAVLAGPVVPRPEDPVLAKVPTELVRHLGRPGTNVFRARVFEARRGSEGEQVAWFRLPYLDVDVSDVALHAGERAPSGRVRIGQVPFGPGVDVSSLQPAHDYWFVTDEAGPVQVLRTFAPAR